MRNHLSFLRHYLEMVAAMFVGMLVLGPVWTALFPGLSASPAAAAMVMATDMALGMAAWMGARGHGRKAVVEMCAAMYAPFVVLLVPYALGVIDGGALMIGGHVLMFPAMALAMLRHRHEYAG